MSWCLRYGSSFWIQYSKVPPVSCVTQCQRRPSPLSQWCILHILPPYFHKMYKFHPNFRKIYKFLHYFSSIYVCLLNSRFLLSHYIDHDAFTHHALHIERILDAPGLCWLFCPLHYIYIDLYLNLSKEGFFAANTPLMNYQQNLLFFAHLRPILTPFHIEKMRVASFPSASLHTFHN